MSKTYVPSKNISIDESMIGMKNQVVYIQYMPNKQYARSRILNKGYHLFTDIFFSKPAEYLLNKKTLQTGTVRANSRGLPEEMSSRLKIGESKFWRKGGILCISFREKKSQTKPVLLLTIAHNAVLERN